MIGPVVLRVQEASRVAGFYERALGFETVESDGATEVVSDSKTLLVLVDDPAATRQPPRTPGLYHVAFLVESREALGDVARRLSESDAHITGAADHLVSEAVYSRDPAGNGIEVYADRPRDDWEEIGGEVRIDTLPLDLDSLTADADPSRKRSASVGHVHLEVSNLDTSASFYRSLGFGLRASSKGVRFLGADGYHHHIAVNTWGSADRPRPDRSEGIVGFGVTRAERRDDPDGIRIFDAEDQTVY